MKDAGSSKVVVITGGSAGIGRATARMFARRGASIGLLARGTQGLEATRQEIEYLGGRALVLPTDVSDNEAVEAAAAAVEVAFGPPDVWVNAAMAGVIARAVAITPEEYRRVTDVTYLGTVWGTLAALRRMKPRDRGVIVQVGSALSYRGIPLQAAYSAAKHAAQGFTESVRSELLHENSHVHLTSVRLASMNTPFYSWVRSHLPKRVRPFPPVYQPEVAARAIVWASEHRRREVYVTEAAWGAILLDKFAPSLADRFFALAGYDAQQTDEPRDPDRPDNLWEPVPGDQGAHGAFDAQARNSSLQLWATMNRKRLALAGAVGLAALAVCRKISTR